MTKLVIYFRTKQLDVIRDNLEMVQQALNTGDPRNPPPQLKDYSQLLRLFVRNLIVNAETTRGQVENSGLFNNKSIDLDKMDEDIAAIGVTVATPDGKAAAPDGKGWSKVILSVTSGTFGELRNAYASDTYFASAAGVKDPPEFDKWFVDGMRGGLLDIYRQVRMKVIDASIDTKDKKPEAEDKPDAVTEDKTDVGKDGKGKGKAA